jgi:hypothetical protein
MYLFLPSTMSSLVYDMGTSYAEKILFHARPSTVVAHEHRNCKHGHGTSKEIVSWQDLSYVLARNSKICTGHK